jgi:hypothetical protein
MDKYLLSTLPANAYCRHATEQIQDLMSFLLLGLMLFTLYWES